MTESAQPITPPERMPLAEFLEWEAAQAVRHERVGGHVWAMVGGTLDHNTIALGQLYPQFYQDAQLLGPVAEALKLAFPALVPYSGARTARKGRPVRWHV